MEGHASISEDVLTRYAADAALSVPGVQRIAERAVPHRRGVELEIDDRSVRIELRLVVDWGASIPAVGGEVQRRVREYLKRMADVDADVVDVVVDEVGTPS